MNTGQVHWIALFIFVGLFLLVTVLGFLAARWKAGDLKRLDEGALGGQRFGIAITWFLVGGDLYTAYTVICAHCRCRRHRFSGDDAIPGSATRRNPGGPRGPG